MKNSCIYCGHKIFYKVSETQRRCCACHKKWSYKKVEQHLLILNAFIENKSALEASELLHLNYWLYRRTWTPKSETLGHFGKGYF